MRLQDITLHDLNGKKIPQDYFLGKKVLIVNVASECGYTRQYAGLQELYDQNKDKLIVLGCPCNDFGGQEPGNENEIQLFCEKNYGVTFPLTEKMKITDQPHPLYDWLCSKDKNGIGDFAVTWNFQKFLVDEKGNLEQFLSPGTEPLSEEITDWLS